MKAQMLSPLLVALIALLVGVMGGMAYFVYNEGTAIANSPSLWFAMGAMVLVALIAVFMIRDRGDSKRMVKALALRVGLSILLFLALMASYYFGLIPGRL